MHRFDPEGAHRLDAPERLSWHDPAQVIAHLDVRAGMTCVDVGAGTGFFALPLAAAVGPTGWVYAFDVSQEMLDHLKARLQGLGNVIPRLSEETRLPLEGGIADRMLLANVFHELPDRAGSLAEARRVLRSGGIVAVLDWQRVPKAEGEPGPPTDHRVAVEDAVAALQSAGFAEVGSVSALALPYHYLLTGRKP